MTIVVKHLRLTGIVTSLSTMLFGIGAVAAADIARMPTMAVSAPAATINPWTYSLTPYFWAPSLNGSSTVKGRTTDVNVSFIDILEHTEIPKDLFGLMAFFEARNGRFSFFGDVVYMKIGLNGDLTRTRSTDEASGSIGASAGLKVEMVIAELAAAYEIAKFGTAGAANAGTAIDLYAGARGWWQSADASMALSGTLNTGDLTLTADRTLTASGSVGWVDPLIGARLRHQFTPTTNLVMSGDVGGFGAGSKFSWQALAALNYDLYVHNNVTWSGVLGYKALYVDYSQGSGLNHYEYNMTMHGPIFGISARF